MKVKLYIFLFVICLAFTSRQALAQGCVAVKDMSACPFSLDSTQSHKWQFSMNYRYFKSYKHYRGSHEEKERVENGTEVINHDNSLILGLSYQPSPRWQVTVAVPLIYIDRSSLYEHYGNTIGNPRFHTQGKGFGDVRIAAYYNWIRTSKFNLNAGLGVKLPTGNYHAKDYFHKKGSQGQDTLVYRYVDQSIQLGDGGFGVFVDINATLRLSQHFSLYGSGFYLFNPRNTNGVVRSANLTNNQNGDPIPGSNEFSVPDQYLVRAGATFIYKKLQVSLGGRMECIPVYDLIGGEDGFRRPGYIISAEPSVLYAFGQHMVGLNVPVALVRNRTRSYIDIQRGVDNENKPYHGDAAFADYLVALTYAFKF